MGLKNLSYSKSLALPTCHPAELDGLRSHKADLVPSLGLGVNPFSHLQVCVTDYSLVINDHKLSGIVAYLTVYVDQKSRYWLTGSFAEGLRLKSGCQPVVFFLEALGKNLLPRSFRLLIICLQNQFLEVRFLGQQLNSVVILLDVIEFPSIEIVPFYISISSA